MEIQKVQPLYQQAYLLLRAKILSGDLKPGESLLESQAARMLSISRTPAREALRQLERDGLVVGGPSDRVIASPTSQDTLNLYVCRRALEGVVAKHAARWATEQDISEMLGAIEDAEAKVKAGDHDGVLTANTRFHDLMVESARIPQLRVLMDTIRGQMLLARRYVLSDSTEAEQNICREHRALLDAVRERDAERALALMEDHMERDIERATNRFNEQPTGG